VAVTRMKEATAAAARAAAVTTAGATWVAARSAARVAVVTVVIMVTVGDAGLLAMQTGMLDTLECGHMRLYGDVRAAATAPMVKGGLRWRE
jgi:hypothetical protein